MKSYETINTQGCLSKVCTTNCVVVTEGPPGVCKDSLQFSSGGGLVVSVILFVFLNVCACVSSDGHSKDTDHTIHGAVFPPYSGTS